MSFEGHRIQCKTCPNTDPKTVYIVLPEGKLAIPNTDVAERLFGQNYSSSITQVNSDDFNSIPTHPLGILNAATFLVRGLQPNPQTIYLVLSNDAKRPIRNMEAMDKYDFEDGELEVPDSPYRELLELIPTGNILE